MAKYWGTPPFFTQNLKIELLSEQIDNKYLNLAYIYFYHLKCQIDKTMTTL